MVKLRGERKRKTFLDLEALDKKKHLNDERASSDKASATAETIPLEYSVARAVHKFQKRY